MNTVTLKILPDEMTAVIITKEFESSIYVHINLFKDTIAFSQHSFGILKYATNAGHHAEIAETYTDTRIRQIIEANQGMSKISIMYPFYVSIVQNSKNQTSVIIANGYKIEQSKRDNKADFKFNVFGFEGEFKAWQEVWRVISLGSFTSVEWNKISKQAAEDTVQAWKRYELRTQRSGSSS